MNTKEKKTSAVKKTKTQPKSVWDYVMKFKKKPLFTIDKKDEDLVYGSNMMTKLLQEK